MNRTKSWFSNLFNRAWVWLKSVLTLERWRPVRRFDQNALERFESEGGSVIDYTLPREPTALEHPVRKSA